MTVKHSGESVFNGYLAGDLELHTLARRWRRKRYNSCNKSTERREKFGLDRDVHSLGL